MIESDIVLSGTRIVCPQCAEEIATTRFSFKRGHMLGLDAFRFAPNHRKGLRQDASCGKCGTGWFTSAMGKDAVLYQIHTEHGWL